MLLDPATGQLTIQARLHQLAGATVLHLHQGRAGMTGPIIATLALMGEAHARGSVMLTPAQVEELLTSLRTFYLDIHTTAFPNGAVRGQLL